MTRTSLSAAVVIAAISVSTGAVGAVGQRPAPASPTAGRTNEHAAALADFTKRVKAYLAVQKDVAKSLPAQKPTEDPAQIKALENALAAGIAVRRATAQHGDIFTPEIQTVFRSLLSSRLKHEEGRDSKSILKDDAPAAVPLKVNAKYPEGASLPTVPADLLINLPTLPEGLDYRIVKKDLVLRDGKANIIVDFIANAIS